MKKRKQTIRLLLTVLAVVLAVLVFVFGIPVSRIAGVYDVKPVGSMIKYGLDLTGGVYVVLQADESVTEVSEDTLEKAITIIRARIDSLGVNEPEISIQGSNKIRVSIPSIEDEAAAVALIGQTAKLQFVDPDGNVIVTGEHVESSTFDNYTESTGVQTPAVKLVFDDEGAALFSEATARLIGQVIYIQLDDEVISAPKVNTQITEGTAYITGIGDKEAAMNLATLIRAGALPVDFTVVQAQSVGATLGQNSLSKALLGGVIGFFLIILFMLVFYRIPGLAADLALCIYVVIFLYIISLLKVTLTLTGIAGIVLSIGMAVDANVIIFERIKEELKLGKSPITSVNSGFSIAFRTVLDANVTTIIAALALFFFGSGTIRGFALTLMIGVAVSMFTAVVVTKRFILAIVDIFGGGSLNFGKKEAANA
ncbi:MAG: protein translocase subunit SecD [Eubacteriaceae bacterium]|nr:protein translocase subunit SecD [Eubacteriaceae bacterium]